MIRDDTFITMTLPERIDAALERLKNGGAAMRIPADQTDADLVLSDCKKALSALAPPSDLVERLQAYVDSFAAEDEGLHLTPSSWNALRADIRAAADALSVREGWIPVSKRLPEQTLDVLCYQENTGRIGIGHWMQRDDGKIWSFRGTSMHETLFDNKNLSPTNFTHWMLLPLPPAGQE